MKREKIDYNGLNAKQKESYNFQKVSAVLADYGYTTILLSDDWQGADFIAMHTSGSFLKVQLKGRFTLGKKYKNKQLSLCFFSGSTWYLYPHDEFIEKTKEVSPYQTSKSWKETGLYSWNNPAPKRILNLLEDYTIGS